MPAVDDTPPIRIPVNALYRFGDRILSYRGRAMDKLRQHLFVDEENVPEHMTDKEFVDLFGAEGLRPVTRAELDAEACGRPRKRISLASPEDLAIMVRRRSYVRAWVAAGRPSQSETSLTLVAEQAARALADSAPPKGRTLGRWIHDWLSWGEDDEALLPRKGGNRTDRLTGQVRSLLHDTVVERYLVNTRPTAQEVHRAVGYVFDDLNAALPEAERLSTPSYQAVLAEIAAVDRFTLEHARVGKRAAEHKFRTVMSGPVVTKHNDAWEVDHTTVDAVVIDQVTGMPIGRGRVSIMLDRGTRVCTSLTMGFESPSASVVLECLAVGVRPKDKLLASIPNVGTWPCFGAPYEIISDQGGDFRSQAFRECCLTIGPDVEFSPVLKAWYRGRIERFFRTLTRSVFHRVPGTTFSNLFQRNKEAIPETVAVCTMDELWTHTVRYIVDIYNRKPHRALGGKSPLQLWDESVRVHGLRPPPPPEKIRLAMGLPRLRTLQRYGIESEGLLYQSSFVSALRVRRDCPRQVKVLVDPNDLTTIRVVDPFNGNQVAVPIRPADEALVRGVPLRKHQLARALQRENPEMLAGLIGLRKAYRMLDESMWAKQRKGGRQNAMEAARHWESLQRAKRRTEDAPIVDEAASARSFVDEILEDEEDDIPAPVGMVIGLERPTDIEAIAVDVEAVEDEASAPMPAEAETVDPATTPKRPKGRPRKARKDINPTVLNEADELDGLVQELGLQISPRRDGNP